MQEVNGENFDVIHTGKLSACLKLEDRSGSWFMEDMEGMKAT